MPPNADGPLNDAKKRLIFDLRRSNDDYSAPTSAQVSSSVQLDADLWKFSGEIIDEAAEDGARSASRPPPLRA